MQPTSEKWEMTIGREKHILNGEEVEAVLKAISEARRIVRFRDLIINPAFVQQIVLVERKNPNQITSGSDKPLTQEQIKKNIKRVQDIKKSFNTRTFKK